MKLARYKRLGPRAFSCHQEAIIEAHRTGLISASALFQSTGLSMESCATHQQGLDLVQSCIISSGLNRVHGQLCLPSRCLPVVLTAGAGAGAFFGDGAGAASKRITSEPASAFCIAFLGLIVLSNFHASRKAPYSHRFVAT